MKKIFRALAAALPLLISACGDGGGGSPVVSLSSGPISAKGRTAVSAAADSIDLRWNMAGDEFEIVHKSGGVSTSAYSKDKNVRFTGLPAESEHTFLIRSDGGERAVAYGYAGSLASQPRRISAAAYDGSAEISWQAVPGAAGYDLYMSDSENGAYDKIGYFDNSTSALVSGLTNGKTYYFKAVAVYPDKPNSKRSSVPLAKTAGTSVFSVVPGYTFGEMTAVTPNDQIDKHSRIFKGFMREGSVRFLWDAVVGAANYRFYGAASEEGSYTKTETVEDNVYDLILPAAESYYKVNALFADGTEGPDSQYIYLQYQSGISWTLTGGIESVTVGISNFSIFDNVTLSCMGVGESEWLTTSVNKTPFTAGPLEAGDYDCKLTAEENGRAAETDIKRVTVYRAPDPDEKLSVYVWNSNATLRWNPVQHGSEAVKYAVLLSLDGGVTINTAADNLTGLSYTLNGLSCGANYTAYVRYYTEGDNSSVSAPVEFALDAAYCASVTPPEESEGINKMTKLLSFGAPARYNHKTAVIGDKIYLFGGRDSSSTPPFGSNEMWVYDTVSDSWTKLSPAGLTPGARFSHLMEALNGKIYIYGGIIYSGISGYGVDDMWEFDPSLGSNGTWRKLSPINIAPQRSGMASYVYNNKIYMTAEYYGETWVYNPSEGADGTWTMLENGVPGVRYYSETALINDLFYVFSGAGHWDYMSAMKGIYRCIPDNGSCVQLNPAHPITGIADGASAAYNDKMYIFGGITGPTAMTADVWRFDPLDGSEGIWEQIVPTGDIREKGYRGATADVVNGKIYIYGGYTDDNVTSSDMFVYEP